MKTYNLQISTHFILTAAFWLFLTLMSAATAGAATFTVTNTSDSGAGSLREAINSANANADADIILFDRTVFGSAQVINLTSATLTISNPLTITGAGARLLTVRRATGNPTTFRIFTVNSAGFVNISGMTISNGNSEGFYASGGGVTNTNSVLTLTGVAVSGNVALLACGGILSISGLTNLLNSTVSGNTAVNYAGGICVIDGAINIANSTISGNTKANSDFPGAGGISTTTGGGTIILNNVTITGNSNSDTSASNSGGLYQGGCGCPVFTRNTVISGNTAVSASPDVFGEFISNGSNLVGNATGSTGFTQPTDKTNVAANLGALANNGGQTDTHALLAGSPALNAGDNCVVTATCEEVNPPVALTQDQRSSGFLRQFGAAVDIGAYELQMAPTAATVSVGGRVTTATGGGITNVLMSLTDSSGQVRTALTGAGGYYSFSDVEVGSTYIITATGKRYTFNQPSQVVNVSDDTTEINFVGTSEKRFRAF